MKHLRIIFSLLLALLITPQFAKADNPTTAEVEAKVDRGIELLKAEGTKAFDKFRDKNGEFVFKGTYIWIHDEDGMMVVHPFKPALEGKGVMGLKDINGKTFFAFMNDLVKSKGSAWVDYLWPKPDSTTPVKKISYVKGVQVEGKTYILGCGLYDVPEDEVTKLLAK